MSYDATPRKKVLVVEDSPTQALHLKAILEDAGLDVYLAANGRVGVEVARKVRPAIVVLDVKMPVMDGIQVCEALTSMAETASIPIVMLTGHDDLKTLMQSLSLGAVDFIPKDAYADAALLRSLKQLGILVEA
jgi:CheY-like chemotaxis protein